MEVLRKHVFRKQHQLRVRKGRTWGLEEEEDLENSSGGAGVGNRMDQEASGAAGGCLQSVLPQ